MADFAEQRAPHVDSALAVGRMLSSAKDNQLAERFIDLADVGDTRVLYLEPFPLAPDELNELGIGIAGRWRRFTKEILIIPILHGDAPFVRKGRGKIPGSDSWF